MTDAVTHHADSVTHHAIPDAADKASNRRKQVRETDIEEKVLEKLATSDKATIGASMRFTTLADSIPRWAI